ncbi:MAG: bifunctional isocitrate dehydrogenase kinase/phosphatase, partial [Cytophagales bacterium]|nr:bifunctional isocitrate dehydrogenase kinase/phosphatase [Cytophagales bacterium]
MNPYSIADTIFQGFLTFQESFKSITDGAKERFEKKDWQKQRNAVNERMLSGEKLTEKIIFSISKENTSWEPTAIPHILEHFEKLTKILPDQEIALTFCISILRRLHPSYPYSEFFREHFSSNKKSFNHANKAHVYASGDLVSDLNTLILHLNLKAPFVDAKGNIANTAKVLNEVLPPYPTCDNISIYKSLFFRNKHAYAVGCLHFPNQPFPFALAFENTDQGIVIDACLTNETEIKNIFSFSRSYLQVSCHDPEELLDYLSLIIPSKPKAQLYINLGYQEHGKELLLEGLFAHAIQSPDKQFIHAEGIKGTVMLVFTIPGTDLVFKITRDHFGPNKDITHADVKSKYSFVAFHDRVGRLVDTQYFEKLSFPISFFNPEFLVELQKYASKRIAIDSSYVEISNVYMERKLTPLNLALQGPFTEESTHLILELGKCIEELGYTNIFPGDLLDKNFGVTSEQ